MTRPPAFHHRGIRVWGLTGSIGMGKTTVARMFQRLGVPVFSSDEAVHQLLGPKSPTAHQVAQYFKGVARADGSIDRARLGKAVFGRPKRLKKLEAIMHPAVQAAQGDFIRRQRRLGRKRVLLDIPLLFETGAQHRLDGVLVVWAPAHIQRRRVLSRPGMTPAKFQAILARQWPCWKKRQKADRLIATGVSKALTFRAVQQAIKDMS